MMVRFFACCLTIAAGSITTGFVAASADPGVYDAPRFYRIQRYLDASGIDRVRIDARVAKLRSCDLESGSGPVWVDFYGAEPVPTTVVERLRGLLDFRWERDPVPPPSAFFQPSGEVAGETRLQAGESFEMKGYSASVPAKLAEIGGTFIVRVPCQLWQPNEDGTKRWGRQVVATFGPLPLPMPNRTIKDYVDLTRKD